MYLFYKEGRVTIPIDDIGSGFGRTLFDRIKQSNIGFWDKQARQFVLSAEYVHQAIATNLFYGITLVRINETMSNATLGAIAWGEVWQDKYYIPTKIEDIPSWTVPDEKPLENYFADNWQEKLKTEMLSRKYSRKTMKSYLHFNAEACNFVRQSPAEITSADIKCYIASLEKDRNLSAATMNLAISALKFFYKRVLGRSIVEEQKRPHKDRNLPAVLSREEVKKILAAPRSLKHRLILTLTYSAGLRVSEVVSLKVSDIDPVRKTLFIRAAKGRKDRYTILSDKAYTCLCEYTAQHQPVGWLFPGQKQKKSDAGRHLTTCSAEKVFYRAIRTAKIKKDASIHDLRHAFATHLLESGTNISYIQQLLGHASLRTTERYTHVAKRDVLSVISPLDTM
jgi:site-specific recombinase XerD